MSTLRLEQQDSYQSQFQSRVMGLETRDNAFWLSLAESLFYPASGGQLFDTGTLNEVAVADVIKLDGEVWHRVETSSFELGQSVDGQIDWPRRYRHMQRHSAQHLLSQAFVRFDSQFETRSVSLRSPVCTIDFAGGPDEAVLIKAEALVNKIAYENLTVKAFKVSENEIARYPLRRPPKVRGHVRLVKMGEFELSACGGTHVRSTAETLPIKLLGLEPIRSGLTRVSFVCGLEALDDYCLKHETLIGLAQSFSSGFADIPERVEALRADFKDVQSALKTTREQFAESLAQNLLASVQEKPQGKVVIHRLEADQVDLLQPLSSRLTYHADVIALLGATKGGRAQLLFSRGEGVEVNMLELLQAALPVVEGRGGGKPDRAQGGGDKSVGLDKALEATRSLLDS